MVTLNGRPIAVVSTGDRFARAYARDGLAAAVNYDYTLTEEFKPGENRSRIAMVSWVMKRRLVEDDSLYYWTERRPPKDQDKATEDVRKWREFRVRFEAAQAKVYPVRAWVQVPDEILHDPESIGDYIDYRLIPRLGTVENEEILLGENGILKHPELTRVPYSADFSLGLARTCNEVEQNAATAHVIILNSADYYGSLVCGGALLSNLLANGNVIIRTRMVQPGCALVGDFNVATRFYHKGRSTIRFAQPPKGLFAEDGIALCAEIYMGVSLNLPTHIYHMCPE